MTDPVIWALGIIATLFLVYGAGVPWLGPLARWGEETFYPLTVLKGLHRVAWPAYFCIAVVGFYFLQKLWDSGKWKRGLAAVAFTLLLIEAGYRVRQIHSDFRLVDQEFSQAQLYKIMDPIYEDGIVFSDYSSILGLPPMQLWHDKVLAPGSWRLQNKGFRISMATGLPHIGSMLSRQSTRYAQRGVQMAAHPLIHRDWPDEVEDDRPVLVILDHEYDARPGIDYIISIADTVYTDKKWSLLSLDPQKINQYGADFLKDDELLNRLSSDSLFYLYHSYATENGDNKSFMPNAGERFNYGHDHELLNISMDSLPKEISISLWWEVDNYRYGAPRFHLKQLDRDGVEIYNKEYFDRRYNYDYYQGWQRLQFITWKRDEADRLILHMESNANISIDELWVQNREDTILQQLSTNPKVYSINNYPIKVE